jgi:bacterial leucyl aminopeptidase
MVSRLKLLFLFALVLPNTSFSHLATSEITVEALVDLRLLNALKIPVLAKSERINVGYTVLTPEMQQRISVLNHAMGRCGGFEALSGGQSLQGGIESQLRSLSDLTARVERDQRWAVAFGPRRLTVPERPQITKALLELKEQNLRDFVAWASSFPTRYNRAADPNIAVRALAEKIKPLAFLARHFNVPFQAEFINHTSTKQQTLRVRILGSARPNEVVVLGGHFDSLNQLGGSAPGADDNASGSSNIYEALRVILMQGPPARTLEFYWYAGEESGLLGSAEIAKQAKTTSRQIIAVLQLDMTLFAGSGEFVVASMTDFTSAWLREFLVGINQTYLGAKIVEDQCGYGCSDHASWYRAGFPTLMPFEATMNRMNRSIHTGNDVITNASNFKHSLLFTKIALIFAMELGNNLEARQPYF